MKKAFTMIELILVIVLLGILSAVAVPKFYDLKAKGELGNLKAELKSINTKTNAKLLKNIIVGQNHSYEDLESTKPASNKIFTALFDEGLKKGNITKGWHYLGKKDKGSSTFTDIDNVYTNYIKDSLKISDSTNDGVYLFYKYSLTKDIYFYLFYRSVSSSFACVKAVCTNCSARKRESVNNLIHCEIPAS